jgi:hypothetical protein
LDVLVKNEGDSVWAGVAKSNIERIESLFVKLGWWSTQTKISA